MGSEVSMWIYGSSIQQQKKNLTCCLFIDEVINTIVRHEVYTFLDGFQRYHHILITPKDLHKTAIVTNQGVFCGGCDVVWCQNWTTYLSKGNNPSIS
jgi:hypothetical protein